MKKIISTILITTMLFAGAIIVPTSAEESTTSTPRASCVKDHFENLSYDWDSTSVPENEEGSCTFVAMSMFFSFYDAYWHDDFVANSLEWDNGLYDSSNDRLIKTFNSNTEYNAWNDYSGTYEEYLLDYQASFLHNYLISIGQTKGYVPNDDGDYGLTLDQFVDMVETYIYQIRRFDINQVEVKYSTGNDDELFAIMENQIGLGYPVIYAGFNTPEGTKMSSDNSNAQQSRVGHAMIAYDIVEDNGTKDVKLFKGYNVPPMFTWVSGTEYDESNAVIWLEIKEGLPHECTNNYYDVHTDENICACDIYYNTHPVHSSNHSFILNSYDSDTHYKQCNCGEKTDIYPHDLTYQDTDDTIHIVQCTECSYVICSTHIYDILVQHSDTEHRFDCVCGRHGIETKLHYAYRYSSIGQFTHEIFCLCGKIIGSEPHNMRGGAISATCVDCGYVSKRPSGNIIMSEEGENDTLIE